MTRAWPAWPMPNQPGDNLPNQQNYMVLSDSSGEVVRDTITGLTWQRHLDARRFSWQDAVGFCDALSLGGWADWRLPSRIELVSLLNLAHTDPSIDLVAFPGTPGEWFWTSSLQADDQERAWYVYFYFGYPDTDPKENAYMARCVR